MEYDAIDAQASLRLYQQLCDLQTHVVKLKGVCRIWEHLVDVRSIDVRARELAQIHGLTLENLIVEHVVVTEPLDDPESQLTCGRLLSYMLRICVAVKHKLDNLPIDILWRDRHRHSLNLLLEELLSPEVLYKKFPYLNTITESSDNVGKLLIFINRLEACLYMDIKSQSLLITQAPNELAKAPAGQVFSLDASRGKILEWSDWMLKIECSELFGVSFGGFKKRCNKPNAEYEIEELDTNNRYFRWRRKSS